MTGENIQQLIYDWLDENLPEGIDWQSSRELILNMPIEIKMISAFDTLEYNMGNGGWAQVLWNCHGQWRLLLEIAREGYEIIGALPQVAAIDKLRGLCEQNESECAMAILADDESLEGFANFTRRSYAAGPDWQELIEGVLEVYEKRLRWLTQNEARVRKAIGLLAH